MMKKISVTITDKPEKDGYGYWIAKDQDGWAITCTYYMPNTRNQDLIRCLQLAQEEITKRIEISIKTEVTA